MKYSFFGITSILLILSITACAPSTSSEGGGTAVGPDIYVSYFGDGEDLEVQSGDTITFETVNIDNPTNSLDFTIENKGSENLLISDYNAPNYVVIPINANFSITKQPDFIELEPMDAVVFTITFSRGDTPSSGEKTATAKLYYYGNDLEEEEYMINLKGTVE